MVDDYPLEKLIKAYAEENNFTLVANKPGALEYVKYDRNNNNELIIMKWYRGASNIMIGSRDKLERFKIESLIE
tara:strand:+ start:690 stop:911 length:222 start_codon:yes stop_codon:yes gene_type:complete